MGYLEYTFRVSWLSNNNLITLTHFSSNYRRWTISSWRWRVNIKQWSRLMDFRELALGRSTVDRVLSEMDGIKAKTESTQYDWLYSAFCWKNCVGTLTTCLVVRTAFLDNPGGIEGVSNWVGPYIPTVYLHHSWNLVIHQRWIVVLSSYSYSLYPCFVLFGFQMQSWYPIEHQLDSLWHERPHTNLENKYVLNMNCNTKIKIKHTKCFPDLALIKKPIWLSSFTLIHWSPLPKSLGILAPCPVVNPQIRDSGKIRVKKR
jgi:hypothetical protein